MVRFLTGPRSVLTALAATASILPTIVSDSHAYSCQATEHGPVLSLDKQAVHRDSLLSFFVAENAIVITNVDAGSGEDWTDISVSFHEPVFETIFVYPDSELARIDGGTLTLAYSDFPQITDHLRTARELSVISFDVERRYVEFAVFDSVDFLRRPCELNIFATN